MKTPKFINNIRVFLNKIHIPMLGISLWKMFEIYGQGLFENQVVKQAPGISWNFFLSIFPFILFLFSVLPYFPHYDELRNYIFEILMQNAFPGNMQEGFSNYIQKNILPTTNRINIFTVLLVLLFASNGTYALIRGFNQNLKYKRGFVKEFSIALGITIAFVSVMFLSILGIYYVEVVLKLFAPVRTESWFLNNLAKLIGYVSFPLFYFILLTLFYWAGCVKMRKFRQAIPGAVLTTVLFILITYIFSHYVPYIAHQNFLYGSIGSIMLLMIWINFNVVLILFGNELNIAIFNVRTKKKNNDKLTYLSINEDDT